MHRSTDPAGSITDAHRDLLADFVAGKRPALARAISIVENGRPGFEAILDALHPRLGRSHRIGITGPPGSGKSTLTAGLIARMRDRGETVGVVAVDPTSPFTGGALLGDRIRMGDVALDAGVFIRSMATRGSLGGLAVTTNEVVDVLDAFGFDRILIETVGVGQAELDIAGTADSTVVLFVPESGDAIQVMKAGLIEVADAFVVNKADRPGAERLARELEYMLHIRAGQPLPRSRRRTAGRGGIATVPVAAGAAPSGAGTDATRAENPYPGTPRWEIPVLRTSAHTGAGVDELLAVLDRHREWLDASGERSALRMIRLEQRVRGAVDRGVLSAVWDQGPGTAMLEAALPELAAGNASPYELAARIVREAIRS